MSQLLSLTSQTIKNYGFFLLCRSLIYGQILQERSLSEKRIWKPACRKAWEQRRGPAARQSCSTYRACFPDEALRRMWEWMPRAPEGKTCFRRSGEEAAEEIFSTAFRACSHVKWYLWILHSHDEGCCIADKINSIICLFDSYMKKTVSCMIMIG